MKWQKCQLFRWNCKKLLFIAKILWRKMVGGFLLSVFTGEILSHQTLANRGTDSTFVYDTSSTRSSPKPSSSWVMKLIDQTCVTWPRGESGVTSTLIIAHFRVVGQSPVELFAQVCISHLVYIHNSLFGYVFAGEFFWGWFYVQILDFKKSYWKLGIKNWKFGEKISF